MAHTVAFIDAALASATLDCIPWPFVLERGYARIERRRKKVRVHRLVCERAHGPPPTPFHHAAHLCHLRCCINPAHLRWSTRAENELDGVIAELRLGNPVLLDKLAALDPRIQQRLL